VLADLDELVLRCRDERAKAYMGEALACYKAGANRAAIIATWIAVTFDIIDKLRELALAGDKAASDAIDEFDAITASQDVQRAQRFERELLKVARDRFELISPQEYTDLDRLQADRHRCAHPSQSAVGETFSPPAELARFHIRSAIEHLLQYEPAQGKAALEGLIRTVESTYFPIMSEKKALAILEKSPLKRARTSLVRNFTLVLLKGLLKEDDSTAKWRRQAAFLCVRVLHPTVWLKTVEQHLTPLVRAQTSESELLRAAKVLYLHSEVGAALEDDQIIRLSEFVSRLPAGEILSLPEFLEDGPFKVAAKSRAGRLTLNEVVEIVDFGSWLGLPVDVCQRMAEEYVRSVNFDTANDWGKQVQAAAASFTAEQLKTILQGVLANDQIRGSFQLRHVISAIGKTETSKVADVAALLAQVQAVLARE
jgi:hypothetical protein